MSPCRGNGNLWFYLGLLLSREYERSCESSHHFVRMQEKDSRVHRQRIWIVYNGLFVMQYVVVSMKHISSFTCSLVSLTCHRSLIHLNLFQRITRSGRPRRRLGHECIYQARMRVRQHAKSRNDALNRRYHFPSRPLTTMSSTCTTTSPENIFFDAAMVRTVYIPRNHLIWQLDFMLKGGTQELNANIGPVYQYHVSVGDSPDLCINVLRQNDTTR